MDTTRCPDVPLEQRKKWVVETQRDVEKTKEELARVRGDRGDS